MLVAVDRVPGLGGGRTHLVVFACYLAACLSSYLTVLKLRGHAGASLKTWTEWDRFFPFSPVWTWVYLLPYFAGPVLVVVLSRPAFAWYLRRGLLVIVVSLLIFAIVPTQTVRPVESLDEGPTGWLYRTMVEVDDPPANAAPSMHVSLTCLLAWALTFDRPRWWWVALLLALLVSLSTLYTAQHHLIDVGSGALLASVAAVGPFRRR
jgi:membrane-associated phospholipid phosphatase